MSTAVRQDTPWNVLLREAPRWLPVAAVFVWAYSTTLRGMWEEWSQAPDYSHCFFVPLFSAWVLWERRSMLAGAAPRGSWWGLLFFAITAALMFASSVMYLVYFERLSLISSLAGVALFVGGWQGLRWAWAPVAYLLFMVPLPGPLLVLLSYPLQRLGTLVATFILQLGGIPAFAQGNVVVLREARVDVVAACSGLRILMLCIAICVGTIMITRRTWREKLIIVASAIPIALLANITRLTATALAYELFGNRIPETTVHDVAGYLMMPGAVGLLWLELEILAALARDGLMLQSVTARIIVAALLLGGIFGGTRLIRGGAWTLSPQPRKAYEQLPARLGQWTLDEKAGQHSFLDPPSDAASAANGVYRSEKGGEVFAEVDQFTRLDVSLPHPPEQCYNLSGCYVRSQENAQAPLPAGQTATVRLMSVDHNGQRMSVMFWYDLDGETVVDRVGLGKVRLKLGGQKTRPLVLKVMLQTMAPNAADAEETLRSVAVPLMAWIRQGRTQ